MNATSDQAASAPDGLEAAADQAIAACGGDARQAVKALIVANDFLETQLEELRSKVSTGYARGRLPGARERKDEADG
ncbi:MULTISPECIES: hypothetical protein [Bradyrhizobium]|uniref:hypothetical protein n=1 Tax=Bradyrhizobium TaxID=374 RepID=UPI0004B6728D|nr:MULTISPECIES: hypothetical protein [Bradyrhizobium]MBR1366842.1 hypothetical protein [Bradyrhizobium ottawaense]MDA9415554.1 hypothetical protein [Bradyrhizobium sp. CCBAU 25360]MDA9456576.1 hypothetical protein [Bradyrhizobium sp. CCBAU 21359]MDA9515449.1 hypothetical protein [Bradyrhizobium sp. CCBAU 11430]